MGIVVPSSRMNVKITLAMALVALVLFVVFMVWSFFVTCGWTPPTWAALSIGGAALAWFVARAPRLLKRLATHQRKTEELLKDSKN